MLTSDDDFKQVLAICKQIVSDHPREYKAQVIPDRHTHMDKIGFVVEATKEVYYFHPNPFPGPETGDNARFLHVINSALVKHYGKAKDTPVSTEATDWDRRMLKMAAGEVNTWSKDPSTKVSATIFNGKYPIASSYNGFPPGIEDTEERLNNRELKYKLVQHAEANAIAACARLGISTNGATMAVTHFPCSTCAGLLIGAGITKIIVQKPNADFLSRWKDSVELGKTMFDEAGVTLVEIDLKDGK